MNAEPSLRTTKTVQDGIKLDVAPHDGLRFIEYQPGNGTRYALIFSFLGVLSGDAKAAIGIVRGSLAWLVTLATDPNNKPSMVVTINGDLLHWRYVQEKLSTDYKQPMSKSDAFVLAEVIGYITGRDHEATVVVQD